MPFCYMNDFTGLSADFILHTLVQTYQKTTFKEISDKPRYRIFLFYRSQTHCKGIIEQSILERILG